MTNEVEPTVLEKYKLDKRLGKGAYGIVWRATEKETSKIVALKKIFDAFRNETDSQRTFREICYLKEFSDHENIIKLYNVIRSENKKDIYLIFEYMPADLESLISRPNVLKNIHKKSIIYQILKGLLYMHSSTVPNNILIDGNCLVKICDFGMARSLHTTMNEIGEVAMTDYVATRWYRAPEILLSSPKYTTKIDMWSLGCIHGELFRGKPLFPGNSTLNQIDYIMSVIPPQSREDIQSINSTYASNLLARRNKKYSQKTLSSLLSSTTPEDALNLLKAFLTFNPNKRISAHDALKHPYLAEFYHPDELKTLYYDVIPPIDEAQKLSISEYREMLFNDTLSDNLRCRRAKHSFIKYKPIKESLYQSAWRNSIVNEKSEDNEKENTDKSNSSGNKARDSWKTLFKSFQSDKRSVRSKKLNEGRINPPNSNISSNYETISSDKNKIVSFIEPIQITTMPKTTKKQEEKIVNSIQTNTESNEKIMESPSDIHAEKEEKIRKYSESSYKNVKNLTKPLTDSNSKTVQDTITETTYSTISTETSLPIKPRNIKKEGMSVNRDIIPSKITIIKSASLSNLPKSKDPAIMIKIIKNPIGNTNENKTHNKITNDPFIPKETGFFKLIKNYICNKADSLKKSIIQSSTCISNFNQPKCNKDFRTISSTITL